MFRCSVVFILKFPLILDQMHYEIDHVTSKAMLLIESIKAPSASKFAIPNSSKDWLACQAIS